MDNVRSLIWRLSESFYYKPNLFNGIDRLALWELIYLFMAGIWKRPRCKGDIFFHKCKVLIPKYSSIVKWKSPCLVHKLSLCVSFVCNQFPN